MKTRTVRFARLAVAIGLIAPVVASARLVVRTSEPGHDGSLFHLMLGLIVPALLWGLPALFLVAAGWTRRARRGAGEELPEQRPARFFERLTLDTDSRRFT